MGTEKSFETYILDLSPELVKLEITLSSTHTLRLLAQAFPVMIVPKLTLLTLHVWVESDVNVGDIGD